MSLQVERLKASPEQTIYRTSWIPPYLFDILHCYSFIFDIWHVCVLRITVCVISRVSVCCGPTYRLILLMHPLNNKEYCTIDFRPGFCWSIAQSISVASKKQCTPRFQTSMGEQISAKAFAFKQCGAGRENDNCVRLKLAKNTYTVHGATMHRYRALSFIWLHKLPSSPIHTALQVQVWQCNEGFWIKTYGLDTISINMHVF